MTEENAPQPEMDQHAREEAAARTHLEANPGDIPPQFGGDVDKFMEAFREQRATLTRTQQELAEMKKAEPAPVEAAPEAAPVETPESLVIPEVEEASSDSDVWADLEHEFLSSGELSDSTRQQLADMNIPETVIDGYLNGIKASQAQAAQIAAEQVGGAENLQSIIDWAAQNLSAEERSSVNAALQAPGWETTLMGLQARMAAAQPLKNEPGPGPQATGSVPTGAVPYADKREMVVAIQDPRYGTDPQYTQFVQDRIRLSNGAR